ncbi:DNA-directed RNA polymerase I subunit RPA1-like [Cucumis melo var. makuwa]|uniref:DNA-directed RNA polymerase I subunit RPA1-like n=1 Tax=Cucumis melo var. makuwa TaxID=1194695 RepID=A0A5A7UP74_CUCMM|nr:DNA-directed RNA polymerase I subunit RPA1-like [Cucumis melo var. makuwa]
MALLFSLEGSAELTLKFSGSAADLVGLASFPWICRAWFSIEGHNRVSGKGFPTTGPRVQAKTVVIHRGLHVSDCAEYLYGLVCIKHWSGCGSWSLDGEGHTRLICVSFGNTRLICASFGSTRLICVSFGSTRLICVSFGSTRLICVSFGSTRLICASFGSTRLICASFGSTRLICAFYGTTRLLCRVGVQRGADRREAGRMREGHMDASDFLSFPLCILSEYFDCDFRLEGRAIKEFGFPEEIRCASQGKSPIATDRIKGQKGKGSVCLEELDFQIKVKEGRSRIIDSWSRKSLGGKRHPKADKGGVEAKYISE